jgi:hypothetical protein
MAGRLLRPLLFTSEHPPSGSRRSSSHPTPAAATRLGNSVIFLDVLFDAGLFHGIPDLISIDLQTGESEKLLPPPHLYSCCLPAHVK